MPDALNNNAGFLIWITDAAEHGWQVHRLALERLRRLADWADPVMRPDWCGILDKSETARAVEAARKRMARDG